MCGKESLTPSLVWQLCLDLWMNQRGAACLIGILPLPDARLHPSTRAGLHQPVEAYVKGREKARPSTWLRLKPPSRAEFIIKWLPSIRPFISQQISVSPWKKQSCRKSFRPAYLAFLRRTCWQKSEPECSEELTGSHVPTTAGFMSSITGGNKNVSPLQIGVKPVSCVYISH